MEAQRLDPALEGVVRRLPGWDPGAVRVSPLPGGITNRNLLVELAGERYVVRLSSPETLLLGIDREAERQAAEAAAALGIGPEVVLAIPDEGILVTRYVAGEPIPPPALEDEPILAAVVRAIRAFHGGPPLPGTFWVPRIVRTYREIAAARGVAIPAIVDSLLGVCDEIETALGRDPRPFRPCHNDLLNANFIRQGQRVWIVDYEYAAMGDPFFDLGNFAVNNGLSEEAQDRLLELYLGVVRPADRARLALMRILSDLREGMWGVVQQGLSSLDFDYAAYARRHLERAMTNATGEEYRRWLDAVAAG
jgi:thiamine kinase-like enzyme